MTDGQSTSLSWNETPIWGLRPDFCYCQTLACLLIWGAFFNKRTGLSITVVAGPRQRSHSRVRIPWDSRPYFIVSDSRRPFSSPPTTCRATVEVFNPASTRECLILVPVVLPITPRHGPPLKIPFPAVLLLLCADSCRVDLFIWDRCLETNVASEPFASNGCFSGSIAVLIKCVTVNSIFNFYLDPD
jgi:hypothetical protein